MTFLVNFHVLNVSDVDNFEAEKNFFHHLKAWFTPSLFFKKN